MNSDIEVSKIVITCINVIILLWLPFMTLWHILQVKKTKHLSYEWIVQILIVFCYCLAVNCEIPALWSRLISYYKLRLTIPDMVYTLTTWDRWGHVLFYAFFSLLSVIVTKKHVPKPVRDFLA